MSNKRIKSENEKIASRNKRIVAHFKSEHKMAHSGESGALAGVYKRLARHWQLPISEIRTIVETAEAVRQGIDPRVYMSRMALERQAKATDFMRQEQAERAAEIWLKEYEAKKLAEAENA